MNRHRHSPPLPQPARPNWLNCPLMICIDPLWTFDMWVDPASFRPFCTLLELHWTMGTLKARPFGLFVPQWVQLGPPACPLLLCDCVSAVWSDVTLRRHYPHHCASLPLCTGNQLWQPWPSNLIGPVTPWPPAIAMVLRSTTITCMQTSGLLY